MVSGELAERLSDAGFRNPYWSVVPTAGRSATPRARAVQESFCRGYPVVGALFIVGCGCIATGIMTDFAHWLLAAVVLAMNLALSAVVLLIVIHR